VRVPCSEESGAPGAEPGARGEYRGLPLVRSLALATYPWAWIDGSSMQMVMKDRALG
jgi:hypothetical protein